MSNDADESLLYIVDFLKDISDTLKKMQHDLHTIALTYRDISQRELGYRYED
jgi:hypothetical protein